MLGVLFQRRCVLQDLGIRQAVQTDHIRDLRLSESDGAGLIHDDAIHPGKRLEIQAAFALIRRPRLAPLPTLAMTDNGVARPTAQGQAPASKEAGK